MHIRLREVPLKIWEFEPPKRRLATTHVTFHKTFKLFWKFPLQQTATKQQQRTLKTGFMKHLISHQQPVLRNARVNDIITQHHTDIHRKVCQNYNIMIYTDTNNIIISSSSISIIINIIIIIITSCHADDWLHAFILRIKEIFCRRT